MQMRKTWSLGLLAVAGGLLVAQTAQAFTVGNKLPSVTGGQETFCTKVITADTNAVTDCQGNTVGVGRQVYGFKIAAATGTCGLIDAATFAAGSANNIIDEAIVTSQLQPWESSWAQPYIIKVGLSVDLTTGPCFIFLSQPVNN